MKIASLLVSIVMVVTVQAQVEKVSFQASGLTCSMCSNAIFKAVKTLDFVENVDVDLKTYTFEVTFNDKASVEFDKIKRKVEGAGFSIISFIATVDFKTIPVHSTDPVIIGNNKIVFINSSKEDMQGTRRIRILDKGFVSAKESRKNAFPTADPTIFHASI